MSKNYLKKKCQRTIGQRGFASLSRTRLFQKHKQLAWTHKLFLYITKLGFTSKEEWPFIGFDFNFKFAAI